MDTSQINLMISVILSFNTIVLAPLFKYVLQMNKRVSYIEGKLDI